MSTDTDILAALTAIRQELAALRASLPTERDRIALHALLMPSSVYGSGHERRAADAYEAADQWVQALQAARDKPITPQGEAP